jgi:hypothetical protein
VSPGAITQRIVAHPQRPACCTPCDLVTFHFTSDQEVHVYTNSEKPKRLTRRLKRLLAELVEYPSAVRAIAGDPEAASAIVRSREDRG